jgi:hypothetical protein
MQLISTIDFSSPLCTYTLRVIMMTILVMVLLFCAANDNHPRY